MRRWVLVAILCLMTTPSFAWDFTLQAGIGYAKIDRATTNGIWYQNDFPHEWDTADLAWKAGGKLHHQGWVLEANYLDLGRFGIVSEAVGDHEYNFKEDYCMASCDRPTKFSVMNSLQGFEVKVGHRWQLDPWIPATFALMGGGAVLFHELDVDTVNHKGHPWGTDFDGTIGAAAFAGEVCWTWLCGEVSYYAKLTENHNPLMGTGMVVPMVKAQWTF